MGQRAQAKGDPEADCIVHLIETVGLPYSEDSSLSYDDPIILKIYEILHSPAGKAAAFEATRRGEPALAALDPMIFAALGVDYGGHNDGTINAGYLIAQMMRSAGYSLSGRKGKLPSGCIAKTAEIYVPNACALGRIGTALTDIAATPRGALT